MNQCEMNSVKSTTMTSEKEQEVTQLIETPLLHVTFSFLLPVHPYLALTVVRFDCGGRDSSRRIYFYWRGLEINDRAEVAASETSRKQREEDHDDDACQVRGKESKYRPSDQQK